MGLKTTCSNCGASFAMKNRQMEGKKVKCKKCGEPFVVKFASGSGNGGGAAASGGLPPKVVGQKPPRKVKTQEVEEAPEATSGGSGNAKLLIIGGSIVGLLVIWTGVMFALGSWGGGGQSRKTEAVQLKFTRGDSQNQKFGVDYPVDWEFKTGGGTGGRPEWIRINADDLTISIKTDLAASAVGDISSLGGTIQEGEVPEELEPIAQVHDFMKSEVEANMNTYDEEPPEKIMAQAGNSRLSKFVGDRGMFDGGKAFGYRATMPCGPDKIKVLIICESQKVFDKYDETLRKIVMSIGP